MPETRRDLSDERSTPTGWSVASLVVLKRCGSGSPISRIAQQSAELRVLESSGDALSGTRLGSTAQLQRPADGRFRRAVAALVSRNCVLRTK
jgi:hypothetical protein